MKLLLTGPTGFLGRNLLLRALDGERYDEIWLPVRSLAKLEEQLRGDGFDRIPGKIRAVVGCAADWGLDGAPRFDHVIHAAGALFATNRQEYFDVNVAGTLALFRAIQRPAQAIVVSSQAASGPCLAAEAQREDDAERPLTWYGQSKLAMEQSLAAQMPDLNYICLRPPMVLGPRDQASLPLFQMAKLPVMFKAGFKTKHYSYISVFDLVDAIFAALDAGGGWRGLAPRHFFVTSADVLTDRSLIDTAARLSGRRGVLVPIPFALIWAVSRVVGLVPRWRRSLPSLTPDRARDLGPERWLVSSRRFQTQFKWSPRAELAQTLRQTRDWYLQTGQLLGPASPPESPSRRPQPAVAAQAPR